VCDAALDRDARERAAFVAAACAGDDTLRHEVEALLAHAQTADAFLATPVGHVAAHLLADEHRAPLVGRQIGSYTILSRLGAGGMGEVYRARDTRLAREVAVKVVPAAFLSDPERLARFEREARVLATLNHPHIAAIYRLEEADPVPGSGHTAVRALVLELVEGATLADRLTVGPVPVQEALAVARQIADALEAAHEKAIIHRDLKPANIKITPDGVVKVLDFGLAKAVAGDGSSPDISQLPLMTKGGTRSGVILGTAAYMSPEQARGKPVDKRTDIWAFGCVLYEMLTGRAAFTGDTVSDTIATILDREPDWQALPTTTPTSARQLLKRCLEKDPKRRLHDIADARIELDDTLSLPAIPPEITLATASQSGRRWMWAAASFVLVAIAIGFWPRMGSDPPSTAPEMRVEITTPPTTDPVSLAISPDAQMLTFVANADGQPRLWLRSLEAVSARPLAGTDGAAFPFWSPDSRSIGFFAEDELRRIDIASGTTQTLANTHIARGGTWNRDGVILFAPGTFGPIYRVSDTGSEPVAVTHLANPPQTGQGHRFPQFLPDGRHFLFYALGSPEYRGVYVASLDGSVTRRLVDADAIAVMASGHLLFVRQGALFAQNFDQERLELTGNPFPVAQDIAFDRAVPLAALSSSGTGPFAYRTGTASGRRQFVWFDRSGKEMGKVGDPDIAIPNNPELSPDGRHVALNRAVDGTVKVWLLEMSRGVLTPFSFESPNPSGFPVWSPEGRRLVFSVNVGGILDLYEKPASGVGTEALLLKTTQGKVALDWSPDGRFLLYHSVDDSLNNGDLWVLPLEGDRKPFPIAQTSFDERWGQFSPDGQWIAYESNESGRFEVYVQPFREPVGKRRMSINGGAQVRWRRDGKELFYVGLDGRLMAVSFQPGSDRKAVETAIPVPLFVPRIAGGVAQGGLRQQYVVSRDGQRFLINTPVVEEAVSPITLVLNWKVRQ
jgi:serine/threonine protein kinase